jgi:hypothetical protein
VHRLTSTQLAQLDRLTVCSHELLVTISGPTAVGSHPVGKPGLPDRQRELQAGIDRAYLSLCVALLDHTLKGDLFDSVIVGFLAVLGIDVDKGTLIEAYSYTPFLSAFVKVSQILVVQSAMLAVEDGTCNDPADRLDEMRERFLIHGSQLLFTWVLRLRVYDKKIRNSTTSMGYIHWLDDNETLYYKDLELHMDRL